MENIYHSMIDLIVLLIAVEIYHDIFYYENVENYMFNQITTIKIGFN